METITFYSYKGGVGRTLALANVAIYLSRFGQNVCIMDFDLEAPGLHYKFPQHIRSTDIKSGLVDIIYEFIEGKVVPDSLERFSKIIISSLESQGGIRLIPAGNVLSADYWRKLASIDWHCFFYEEGSEGVPFFLELKERIENEFKPDFLLIDSRTGITEMSGLCTSLFPDKVVFLIVNNRENIEGARQILQSIQKLERLPGQKSVQTIFALTRVPFPKEEKGGKEDIEGEILKNIRDLLNEPTEDLESQLNVEEIYVLHSDRELELSESLRISQVGIFEETPLSRDYLRLFSKIVPDNVVVPKLDNILDKITTNIWEDPEKTQKELEGLVASYLHSKTLEKLIDFYVIRNEKKEKMLNLFHKLWEISGDFNSKTFSKYISLFLREEEFYTWSGPRFNLAIVEEYLNSNPDNRIEIMLKLAEASRKYDRPKVALKYYFQLLEEAKEKESILGRILDIYISKESYDEATKLIDKYPDIISNDDSLLMKKIEIIFKSGRVEEIRKLLEEKRNIEETLFEKKPILYVNIMDTLGKSDEANNKLNMSLEKALRKRDARTLLEVGGIFYRLGRVSEFKSKITDRHPEAEAIIRRLEEEMEPDAIRRRHWR